MSRFISKYGAPVITLTTAFAVSVAALGVDYALQERADLAIRLAAVLAATLALLYLSSAWQRKYAYPSFAEGALPYNLSIMRTEFRFPGVLSDFEEEIFLAGPNQNHLLNRAQNREAFNALIDSLRQEERRIYILIADPTSQALMDMYGQVSAKGPSGFLEEETEIRHSIAALDQAITERLGPDALLRVRKGQLEIRGTSHYLDSFCFIDASAERGKGYFMLVTRGIPGGSRPIYYFSKKTDPILFSTYYQLYRENIYEAARILWPS